MKRFLLRLAAIFRFAAYDFKSRYTGSALGAVWAIAEPLVTIIIYRFVYTIAFGGADIDGVPYYIWLSIGIAPWFFISDGLRSVCSVFRDYSYIVKKMRFDKSILPSARAVSSLFSHLIFMLIIVAVCIISKLKIHSVLYLVLMIFITYIFVYTLGRIAALICIRLKDTQNVLSVIVNIAFWITPIFWNTNGLSEKLLFYVRLNPAALIAEGYRLAILKGEMLDTGLILYLSLICLVLIVSGNFLSRKILPTAADIL